jgi:zinc transport system substrate-binding protein
MKRPPLRLSSAMALMSLLALVLAAVPALAEPMPVTVSIAPQAYFVKRIGGDKIDVATMVPPGADAHTFEPKPSQMAALQKAKIYFALGIDFEKAWLPRFADMNKTMAIVRTDEGIVKMAMVPHAHAEHDHAAEAGHDHQKETAPAGHDHAAETAAPGHGHGHHDHAGLDPHVWLSPAQGKILATAMRDALIAADPANTDAYRVGYESLVADINALDARLKAIFAPVPRERRKFMVFHPAWGYFARQYGLTQVPVESEGKEPGPAELAALIDQAGRDGIRVVFVQPQFSTRSAEVVARGIGGTVVPVDPLAEDWLANMDKAAAAFQAAMKEK